MDLAQVYGRIGVRVNTVNPAAVTTDRLRQRYALSAQSGGRSIEQLMRESARDIPLGRFADPVEVAAVGVFLASPRAGYVAGASLMIDGGERPIV